MHIYVTSNRQKVETLMFYILRRGWGTANSTLSSLNWQKLSLVVRKPAFCICENKDAGVTPKLISAFVFATRIVKFLYFLNPKFQASSHLLWLYSLVCIGPGRKPRRPVFSQRGSIKTHPSFTMPVLVTWKGPIQNNREKVETPFSLFYGDIFYLRKGS